MRLIDADRFITTLDTVVQKHESKLWREIAETMKYMIETQAEMFPIAEPKREWHPVDTPPTHHRDVIVRGIEAIGNVTVHKVMQWDVDTWRPTNYAPSISWKEWSEIDE